jgi:hypothetical protein
MPWRGPEFEGELPSLGWEVLEWASEFLPSPRNHDDPLVLTDSQAMRVVRWFTIHPQTGKFVYRRRCHRGAKGKGKSPEEAVAAIAELAGPVRFAGWSASGEPLARPWGTMGDPQAWVQIAAVSEDQTENTHSVIFDLLTANESRAAERLKIDVGLTRSYLRDGKRRGKLEPVTASAGTREGQPVTYVVMDETHLWKPSNGGVRLARTVRRNAAKMDGRTSETTNSFEPGEGTVAEGTHKAAMRGAEGILYEAVEAPRIDIDQVSDDELRRAMAIPFEDAWWIDLDRLVREARDPDMPREDVERFLLNWNVSGSGKAVEERRWRELASSAEVPIGARVGLGFDGSISEDATVLRGCTEDGHTFLLHAQVRPLGVAGKGWKVNRQMVHDAVALAFERFSVGRMLCDPPKWWTEIEQWAQLYGDEVVLGFDTNSDRRMAPAVDRWLTAIREGDMTHDGDPVTNAHVTNAHKRKARSNAPDDDNRTLYTLTKGDDGGKIDAAVADVLAFEAAMTMPEVEESDRAAFVLFGNR